MDDLNNKYRELADELMKNFSFYIPFDVLEDKITEEIFNFSNLELTQEFVDNYVDVLLCFDEDLAIKAVDSFEALREYNMVKWKKLESNCFKLVHLKDSLGKTSFNFLFKKYIEQVVVLNLLSDKLIYYFYIYYPDNVINPTYVFEQQKIIFNNHLAEIENKIGVKGGKINSNEIINYLIKASIFKPYVREKGTSSNQEISIHAKDTHKKKTDIIPFRNFLKHDKKAEIETIVKTHFSDLRGVSLRHLIQYFEDQGLFILNQGESQKLYDSIKDLFEGKNIASYNGIFNIPNFSNADLKYLKKKISFDKIFKDYIQNR